jgi:NADH:ubiquinone reductase (H+-translocating)
VLSLQPAQEECRFVVNATSGSKHVLIVGGGFAGLGCALELARLGGPVQVTLIDRHNYHQFQPLFYQLATSQLSANDVSFSLRRVCRDQENIDIKLAEVDTVDPQSRTVHTKEGESYQGDYLVLAAGSQANFFHIPGADINTFPLYSLNDAERLRSRILALFEDTDRDSSLIAQGALNFVIVGAGPTGTEMAGGLADMIHTTVASEYADLAVSAARVYIVERGSTLLPPFSQRAHEYAGKVLQRDGVELRLNASVTEVHSDHVVLGDGSIIKTRCVIWGAGLMAAPIARTSGLPTGRGGRIQVEPDLTVAGLPNVYALGDFANIAGPDGKPLPQLGSVALQSGRWAGKNIHADLSGKPRLAFHYLDKGIMAMIGRNAAIAEVGEDRHELNGAIAYAMWLGVHLALLTTLQVKVETFIEWVWDYFLKERGPQLLDRSDAARIDWYGDGEAGKAAAKPAEAGTAK